MAARPVESRVTGKGQTTIPAEVREKLQIGPGDTIQYVLVDGRCEIIPRNRPAESLFGLLREYAIPNTSLDDYRNAIGEYFQSPDGPEKQNEAA